jgi:cobalt-zinc-cadmium efflux system outer membrane protein
MTAARAGVARARAGVADATRLTIGDVDRTFYRLVSATRRTELADEVFALNQRVTDVASRQLAAGEISKLDYNLAVVELGRSRALALATRRERAQVATEFGRLLGVPLGTLPVPVIDSTQHPPPADSARVIPHDVLPVLDQAQLLNVDSLTMRALAMRPDLQAQSAAVQEANAEASLARREGLPNLIARVASEPRGSGTGHVIRPGVGITLPFFNRNQGDAESRRAAARQAVLARDALVSRVRADIASTVAIYQSAAAEVEVLESTVLAPARQNRQLLETAYREGKVGLPVLLLIRNQVIDAELDYWTAWLAEREALSNLDEAIGRNMPSALSASPTPSP